jgi:hypothetical protein
VLTALFVVIYGLVLVGGVVLVVGTPFYLAVKAYEEGRAAMSRRRDRQGRPPTRERARIEAELREQYASGMLTLVGLEERLDETLRARSHLELEHVLDDLPPPRRQVDRVSVFEACAGALVLLVVQAPLGKLAGVALTTGAVLPAVRWRPVVYAFLAGLALLVAPFAAVPLAASAGWRWFQARL